MQPNIASLLGQVSILGALPQNVAHLQTISNDVPRGQSDRVETPT